jgi:hypothetical protein
VHWVYEDRLAELGIQMGDATAGRWEAARLGLVGGAADFTWLRATLPADDDPRVCRPGSLTELLLLDIPVWTLGGDA